MNVYVATYVHTLSLFTKSNRYIQLLQALIIFTPTDHSDKANIIKFVEQLELLSSEVKQVHMRVYMYVYVPFGDGL